MKKKKMKRLTYAEFKYRIEKAEWKEKVKEYEEKREKEQEKK